MQHAEQTLLEHLVDPDSLDILSREGFHQEISLVVVPTETLRKIVGWAVSYYWSSGRKVAPSREAILETWGDSMEAMEIEFGDPTEEIDSVENALEVLRGKYANAQTQKLLKQVAQEVNGADNPDKVARVAEAAHLFYALTQSLTSRRQESEGGAGFEDSLRRHEDRRINGHTTRGMLLGLDEIDEHIFGIHPGEIAIFGMTTGGGKSWLGGRTVLKEWERGRRATLFTLENDLEMTFDRLVCMQARVPYEKWQRGEANEGQELLVKEWTEQMMDSDHQPVIIQPDLGERDPVSMIRRR